MLKRATLGFGGLALADLLSRTSAVTTAAGSAVARAPLAAVPPHVLARAKQVIYIFLDGGLSQVDSYDYKPLLQRDDGKPLPESIAKPKFSFAPTGQLLGSPFAWKQYGKSGAWASELFPEVNKLIDDLCFIKSLHHDNEDHFTAKNMIATGSGRETRPAVGSWVAYGLGTENENLPAFVEIMPGVDGLLHVSEIALHRVKDVRDELKEGEQILVKVLNVDPSGKIRLSRKALLQEEQNPTTA